MLNARIWTAVLGLLLLVSLIDRNDAAATSLTPFQLTYLPAHVVKHMTKLVTIRCAHEDYRTASQLQEITRIRMLKKSATGWELLAEIRDNEATPKTHINVSVSARISSNIRDNFIEIVWPVASDDTFGIYRCDVIGFDKINFLNTAEVTSEVALLEENVTTSDMLDMFLETKDEMHHIEDETLHLEGDVGAISQKISKLDQDVKVQSEDISRLGNDMSAVRQSIASVNADVSSLRTDVSSLKSEADSVDENTRKINTLNRNLESMKSQVGSLTGNPTATAASPSQFGLLRSWPTGTFALLQPKTGCPVDLTFFGGTNRYWQVHTESSSGLVTRNAHSDVFSPHTLSTIDGKNFLTLRFCEANGILNTGSWPSGSYCINRIVGTPCPSGFSEGEASVDNEDSNHIKEHTSRSLISDERIAFCCMTSGSFSTEMTLPSQSPFLLYRRGGQCQKVTGMTVNEETITIDTEDSSNGDLSAYVTPDISMANSVMKFHLCYYTPE